MSNNNKALLKPPRHASTAGRPWAADGAAADHDILDFAVLWAPIGGPSAQHIHAAFGLAAAHYSHRLDEAVRRYRTQRASRCAERTYLVYSDSVLTAISCGTTVGSSSQERHSSREPGSAAAHRSGR